MSYTPSSAFLAEVVKPSVYLVRRLTIAGSDYSANVTKWPKVSRAWNDIKPVDVTLSLANHAGDLSVFMADPLLLRSQCLVEMGVQFATGSQEYLTVFEGTLSAVRYTEGGAMAEATITDKTKVLTERVVGNDAAPVTFTSTGYLPSDLAWWVCTSYGGLSSVKSTSNPDIDYAAFSTWAAVFSLDNVRMQAKFNGQKVTEILRKVGRMTGTSIFEEGGRVTFARFDFSSAAPFEVRSADVFDLEASIDDTSMINRQWCNAAYVESADAFGISVFNEVSASVNSYGAREQLEEDTAVWYTNSVSALNFCQRTTTIYGTPKPDLTLQTGVQLLGKRIGDTVVLNHGRLGQSGDVYRIMGYSVDMDKGGVSADLSAAQLLTFFILDDATMGLLDQSTNPLG